MHGVGVMPYVRGDIPSRLLTKHHFSKNIEEISITTCRYMLLYSPCIRNNKYRTEECREALRKQKNYCNRLRIRGKKEYYSRLNLNNH